jgi:hypothetical protein
MIVTAECPSGLVLDVRELKGREIRQIREVKNPLLTIAEGCTVKVVDAGPYVLHDGKSVRWGEALAGDMMTAILRVAEAGFGVKRKVPFECTDEDCRKRCPEPTLWPLDLRADLAIRPISPEDLQAFLKDNRFEDVIEGARVVYRLPTGATIDAAFRQRPDAHEWKALADGIIEIEGVRPFDQDKLDWIDNLSADGLRKLGLAMGAREPGPPNTLKVQCHWCGRERVRVVPFAGLTFEA